MSNPEHNSDLPEVYDEIEGIRSNIRSLENDDFEGQLAHAKEELEGSSYKMSVNASLFHTLLERSTKLDAAIYALEKIRLLRKDGAFQLNVDEIIANLWEEGRQIADVSPVDTCQFRSKPGYSDLHEISRHIAVCFEKDGPSLHATFDGHHTSDSGKVQIPKSNKPTPIRGKGRRKPENYVPASFIPSGM